MIKLNAKKCFIATVTGVVMFVVYAIFEWHLLAILSLLSSFVFLTFGLYKYQNERVRREYAEFSDMSKFYIGMPKEEVEKLNSNYIGVRIDETNEALSGICETCGGKVVNGVCAYCGNVYDDSTKISYIQYNTRYGGRLFTFKGPKLTNMKIELNPIEKFL